MHVSLNLPSPHDPLRTLRALITRGRHLEAERLAQAQRRRVPDEQSPTFLGIRAEISLGLGRFGAALDWAGQALRGLKSDDRFRKLIEASRVRALIGLGKLREAESRLHSLLAEDGTDLAEIRLLQASLSLHSGRWADAARAAREACAEAESSRRRTKLVEALLIHARVSRELGDASGARRILDRAQRHCDGLRDPTVLASVLSERADFLAHLGDWAEAERNADQSSRLYARVFSPHEHLTAGRRTGLLGLAKGDPREALPSIERAADVARRGYGAQGSRAEIELLLADAQLAGLDPEAALDRATAALGFFRTAQDPAGLARAHVRRSIAALSARNLGLAFREARFAGRVEGAGPVAEGLADVAFGRVLLRNDPGRAKDSFERASRNASLYPPLRSVAKLGAALAEGASPQSDQVQQSAAEVARFGDRRILAIVRADLRELYAHELHEAASPLPLHIQSARYSEQDADEGAPEFLPGLVGAASPVLELGAMVRRAAASDLPVSIYGETGTGKENVARALHVLSPRVAKKFVALNAASLSDELFESEMFGHVRGSFTGAQSDRVGIVEDAAGGTLFIDEVADLSARSQVRLLRFLQDGVYRRIGENRERRSDVRIVVAANQPLDALVAAGRFRQDLLFRLRGFHLTVPSLRERAFDVIRLARHFVTKAGGGAVTLTRESEAELLRHSWPGNVRELEQEMKRATALADCDRIDWKVPAPAVPGPEGREIPKSLIEIPSSQSLHEAVGAFERLLLKSVLARCAERVDAARLLGISRQALHQKIVRYGL